MPNMPHNSSVNIFTTPCYVIHPQKRNINKGTFPGGTPGKIPFHNTKTRKTPGEIPLFRREGPRDYKTMST